MALNAFELRDGEPAGYQFQIIVDAALVKTLAILSSGDDQFRLSEIFRHSKWDLYLVQDLRSMHTVLHELAPGAVISDCSPPDGSWKEVLLELAHVPPVPPPLIVASRLADERLWAEVLNLCGYDLLMTPFDADEVMRTVSFAWRLWRDQQLWSKREVRTAAAAT